MKRLLVIILPIALACGLSAELTLHTVNLDGMFYKDPGKGGTYERTFPDGVSIPADAFDAEWDADGQTLTYSVPAETEDGEPTEGSVTFTDQQIEAAKSNVPPQPEPPLDVRLMAHMEGFAPATKAKFPFERVAYWLDQKQPATAKAVIEATDVSGESQAIQDAKTELLGEF